MAQKRTRISWKPEAVEKTFVEACIHEITLHGREGGSLKSVSWKNVAAKLKTEHNFFVDKKQMKNRYDYLKSKFGAWTKLKNKSDNVYDPLTNTFNLSKEEWQLEMESNKYVKILRRAPLSYPKLCVQLFEGSASNGFESGGPSSTIPHPSEEVSEHNSNAFEDIECIQMGPSTQDSDDSFVRFKKRGEKRKDKETLNSKLIEVGEHIIKLVKMMTEKHGLSNDMDACMEKLRTLGWDELDVKYQTTLLLFGESADIRKVWLQLQPHVCELWVKNAGAKYGLF